MELSAAERAYDALHEKRPYHDGTFTRWAEKHSREFPYHARDGVTFFVADEDVNPGDRFTTETNAIPEGVDDGNSP